MVPADNEYFDYFVRLHMHSRVLHNHIYNVPLFAWAILTVFWVTGNWEAYYSCWFCTSRSFAEDYINFMLGHLRHFRNISIDDKLSKLH